MASNYVEVEGLNLHYLEEGSGEPVLLLHGWPTSSYLWRNVIPPMARHNRVIAPDLPGFGNSDKPLDVSYSFRFFGRVLTGFLDRLGIERVGLAVHDIGGPIGLYWGAQHRERVSRLALLNTLVYSRPSLAVIGFVIAARTPLVRSRLTSPGGIRFALRFGVADKSLLTDEAIAAYQEPFATKEAQRALQKAGTGLHPKGFKEIERWLPRIEVPVRIVYGEKDRILPDVKRTMRKVTEDVPGEIEASPLPDVGHFLQEERPTEIAGMLSDFFRVDS